MSTEREHVGMDGKPCQCTPYGRRRARRGCSLRCWGDCCNGQRPHAKCPNARPCIGGCGRLTTACETTACGYCAHCAGDQRWRRIA
jgi:hypothetical protein